MSAELLDFDADHALKESVCDGDAELLAVLLRKHGDSPVLQRAHNEFDGTLHFHALNTMMVMAGQPVTEPLVAKFAACARALRIHGAPVEHQHNPNGIAMVFLDSCWSTSAESGHVAEVMRAYIDARVLDVNAVVPRHSTIAGLAPICVRSQARESDCAARAARGRRRHSGGIEGNRLRRRHRVRKVISRPQRS